LLPTALLRLSTRGSGETLVPHYLTERDYPWLRALLDEHERFVGRRRSELRERMHEPLSVRAPKAKLRFVAKLLETLACDRAAAPVPPREARALTFRAATSRPFARDVVLANVAGELRVGAPELELALFADLASERRIAPLREGVSPTRLAADANLAIVRAFLRRALRVRISAWGHTRALVRQAHLTGLICLVQQAAPRIEREQFRAGVDGIHADDDLDGVVLDISGPFALFRHTEVYGRALASLVPRATWCNHFEMVADCALGRGTQTAKLMVRSGDPIGSGRELAKFDSRLEQRFAKEFGRATTEWDVVREPRPLNAGGTLVFPDFELVSRREPERRWFVEIAGFWTPEYLTGKLERLRAAGIERLVLCIDERRKCSDSELPREARIVRYKNRVDPATILAIIQSP
jgi:predicted nuclease of restriction endonuclease-like RecB superfamily